MVICDNCGGWYPPHAYRWRCPHCGWKTTCCDGEPAPAPDDESEDG